MQIYNTMTRKKEEFVPLERGKVSLYVCGPTVYNYFHIGNARAFAVFDTLRHYLEYCGYEVNMVQNFTDIDDKLIRKANEENSSVGEIAERYIKEYYTDADSLGITRATCNPRATQHIGDIIALVQKLIEKGHAYVADNGDVYFSVRSYPEYGKLSGQSIDDLESGARVDPTEQKRDPLDFAVWKSAKAGEPSWPSPWGEGRPGWHIECSAMSMDIFGPSFDIHAGGQDLVFPHHENEIAQSEAATGKPFAKYWMHNAYLNINNEKMSKSKGNFTMVRDIVTQFDPMAVKLFLISAQYRSPVNFSHESMEQADAALARIRNAYQRMADAPLANTATDEDAAFIASVDESRNAFGNAMDDDLNTADALGVLFDFIRTLNTFVSEAHSANALEYAKKFFDDVIKIFGMVKLNESDDFPAEAVKLLAERGEARKNKDWARADAIRDELKAMGFVVEDGKDGAKLKKA